MGEFLEGCPHPHRLLITESAVGTGTQLLRCGRDALRAKTVDLRREPVDEVLHRVEQSLKVRLDRRTVVRKCRSVGARTDRDTWVRIERRGVDRIGAQGGNGPEAAAILTGRSHADNTAWSSTTAA
ncbi:hypothetical protein GCM10010359_43560 [Streptomyces morookaense]|nr:hypothetical protein GCM10010359_43560 [Streptomyces morookaense]